MDSTQSITVAKETQPITIRVRSALSKQLEAAQAQKAETAVLTEGLSQKVRETLEAQGEEIASLKAEVAEVRAQLAQERALHAKQIADLTRKLGVTVHRDIEAMFTEVEEKIEAIVSKYMRYQTKIASASASRNEFYHFSSPALFSMLEESVLPQAGALRSAPCVLEAGALADVGAIRHALAPEFEKLHKVVTATYGSVQWDALLTFDGKRTFHFCSPRTRRHFSAPIEAKCNRRMHKVQALLKELTDMFAQLAKA